MESLQEIIASCLENNQRYQKAFYERYFGYCLKIVFRYIYRYEKAIDIVNDGYVKIFRNLSKFHYENPENLEKILLGWMRTIMVNTAIDALRKDSLLPEIGALDDHMWDVEDRSRGADQKILYKELILEVKKLPPSYRAVFNMYVIDGFTHQEIANSLGISVGASKSNLSKARALLQKKINDSNRQLDICNI
ncbi:MAG TPA: RNA polymerase sigma factor [Puia sp.]|nr:RNA polymerase sigma factor [Puia sp.]